MTPSLPAMLAVMAAAALLCRFAGYAAMRFLPRSARLDAALKATPLAVMAGIAAQALAAGGLVEALALATAIALSAISRNDIAAALAGVAVAAALRAVGL
ncbi:branched-chain amino acid ABC transporter [Rhodobacter sp. SGA-6-6]|uniref:AzlD domain-containing protein n=1 Tax=Rhodobacter sp. SGA-6-6 TaxID=2710882 RepID=UPI0013E9D2FA|nr:AzlD domain-containing protein [Rhodobacter sp. SGA-6-6]NGM44226.1 branched-chain amino acid ABC transporter [Rhodobacter sp. SGA-6-6]